MNFKNDLRVGVIQTTLAPNTTWHQNSVNAPEMDTQAGEAVWNEIETDFRAISEMEESARPEIVLMPEITIPLSKERLLENYARKLKIILIAGLDFRKHGNYVVNEALVCIPSKWPFNKGTGRGKSFKFGKKYASHDEKEHIKRCSESSGEGLSFKPAQEIYILDLDEYGMAGFTICADFYDLDRYAIYRGRIQHLFLLAYNKDLESFRHIAESISRIVYCNVVICNCGYYGGSIVFHPAYDAYSRYIYRHEGANLHSLQVVKIPVRRLMEVQSRGVVNAKDNRLKNLPPGYELKLPLEAKKLNGKVDFEIIQ